MGVFVLSVSSGSLGYWLPKVPPPGAPSLFSSGPSLLFVSSLTSRYEGVEGASQMGPRLDFWGILSDDFYMILYVFNTILYDFYMTLYDFIWFYMILYGFYMNFGGVAEFFGCPVFLNFNAFPAFER